MSLYPSLEDMKVDHIMRAQMDAMQQVEEEPVHANYAAPNNAVATMYPALGNFMGLELGPEVIAANMPEYSLISSSSAVAQVNNEQRSNLASSMVAPISGGSLALHKSFVTQGIRQITLCKDGDGKIGLRLKAIDNGIFVCLVMKGSVAAMAGLRFGDQILEINDIAVAGMSMDQAHKMLKNSPVNGIRISLRDRPFERTLTLHKDSVGQVGFQFKEGKIVGLVKDSSAARNGLLIEHQLVEINGQNVVGLKDKEISKIMEEAGPVLTLTILPYSIYKHMIKKMATNLLKNSMDHTPAV